MKTVILSLAALIFASAVLANVPASAEEPVTVSDEHAARIKTNCQSALTTLHQIRANDGPVFVNRNQAYFSISDKLMARLNSRLAFNRYDTTALAKIANEYNQALAKFRSANKEYSEAMGDLVKLNCIRQPASFYEKTAEVRKLRGEVQAAIQKLHTVIEQYRQEVTAFKSTSLGTQRVEASE